MTVYEQLAYELKNIENCLNFQIELANDNKFVKKGRISCSVMSQTHDNLTEMELQAQPAFLEIIEKERKEEEDDKSNEGGEEELRLGEASSSDSQSSAGSTGADKSPMSQKPNTIHEFPQQSKDSPKERSSNASPLSHSPFGEEEEKIYSRISKTQSCNKGQIYGRRPGQNKNGPGKINQLDFLTQQKQTKFEDIKEATESSDEMSERSNGFSNSDEADQPAKKDEPIALLKHQYSDELYFNQTIQKTIQARHPAQLQTISKLKSE